MLVSKMAILNTIYERRTLDIFKSIASSPLNSEILKTQLNLTRRQFYTRMSLLLKIGLVKRQKSRYLLTALGNLIYEAHINLETKIERAARNYWKLNALDAMEISSYEKSHEIISSIIADEEIKSILLAEMPQLHVQALQTVTPHYKQ